MGRLDRITLEIIVVAEKIRLNSFVVEYVQPNILMASEPMNKRKYWETLDALSVDVFGAHLGGGNGWRDSVLREMLKLEIIKNSVKGMFYDDCAFAALWAKSNEAEILRNHNLVIKLKLIGRFRYVD